MMTKAILGVDVSKKKFDVTLLLADGRIRKKVFSNDPKGFHSLSDWLLRLHQGEVQACMEFTGIYDERLAEFLHQQGLTVSRVNAMAVKAFATSMLTRTKTDKKDSMVIAQFCKLHQPKAWEPDPLHITILRDLSRTLDALKEDYQLINNRLEKYAERESPAKKIWQERLSATAEAIKDVEQHMTNHIKRHPDLKKKIELLQTISGIGETSARVLIAEIPDIQHFKNARQLAAFAGLTPCQRQSGSSVMGKTRLSKMGSARLRKALFMPALVAKKYNPVIMEFSNNLLKKGKCKMAVIGAAMRKLLHIVFGVLKHQIPFGEKYA
jgi:transposase